MQYSYEETIDLIKNHGWLYISEKILHKPDLSTSDKFILAYTHHLNKIFNKFATNKLLADFLNTSERNIQRRTKKLFNLGYLIKVRYNQNEIKKILSSKVKGPKLLEFFSEQCEWCKNYTCIIHNHHFPVPKKDGGKLTVKLCILCHLEYHYLIDTNFYQITDDLAENYFE